jgi:hypothetical protein
LRQSQRWLTLTKASTSATCGPAGTSSKQELTKASTSATCGPAGAS